MNIGYCQKHLHSLAAKVGRGEQGSYAYALTNICQVPLLFITTPLDLLKYYNPVKQSLKLSCFLSFCSTAADG